MQSSLLKDIFFSLERDFIKSPSHFVFSADNVPVSTAELAINNLVIKIGTYGYGSYTVNFVDMLSWSAEKDTYRHIAYLMLSKIFHRAPASIAVHLKNPSSDVKTIIFDYCQDTPWNVIEGYEKRPYQWIYQDIPTHNAQNRAVSDWFFTAVEPF
jgi:hypothetical protein